MCVLKIKRCPINIKCKENVVKNYYKNTIYCNLLSELRARMDTCPDSLGFNVGAVVYWLLDPYYHAFRNHVSGSIRRTFNVYKQDIDTEFIS